VFADKKDKRLVTNCVR